MIYGGLEDDNRRRVRIVVGECEAQFKSQVLVRSRFWALKGTDPSEERSGGWESGNIRRGGEHESHELRLETEREREIG